MIQKHSLTQNENIRIQLSQNQSQLKNELSSRFERLPAIPLELFKKNSFPIIQTTKELQPEITSHENAGWETKKCQKNLNFRQKLQKVRPKIHFLSELQKPATRIIENPQMLNREMDNFKSKLESINKIRQKLARDKILKDNIVPLHRHSEGEVFTNRQSIFRRNTHDLLGKTSSFDAIGRFQLMRQIESLAANSSDEDLDMLIAILLNDVSLFIK